MGDKQRYRVIERLAAGGMAEVFRGESAGIEGFRKRVAIKRVLPKLSANHEFINMFLDEARLCAYLSHSKCVQVFDIGEAGGSHFIVMEFVDGADLKEVLDLLGSQGRVFPLGAACRVALEVCEGLAYAHDAVDHAGQPLNIVHRDISPHNVLMTRYGEVKLVDFGLAKASSHLTKDDEDIVKGKFGYLAPEVTLGQGADRRVDIFAAGIILWEMLAGRRLFQGTNDVETFHLVRAAIVPDIRGLRPDVNDDIAYVLTRALARDPAQRYATAHEMAYDLGVTLGRLGQPVTYLDLAGFVAEAVADRKQRKRSQPKLPSDFIGDVVIDALHSFSADAVSEQTSRLGTAGVEAGTGEFIDPTAWGFDEEFGDLFTAPEPRRAERVADAASTPPGASSQATSGAATSPPLTRRSAAERARAPGPQPPNQDKVGPWWRRWFTG
ncbi:MAG: serine/threonine protein kinase [Polyangiaceae bacterium]|nr:serine/threonine protein kinase [Polyangiaceae bacterium]